MTVSFILATLVYGLPAYPAAGSPKPAVSAPSHGTPDGLSRDDWGRIRRSISDSGDSAVHEAQLFGHGDPFGDTSSEFGYSASLFGDSLIVGAPFDDAGPNGGAAYVFVRSGTAWVLQQRLLPSGGGANGSFGAAVALFADTAVVGASADNTAGGLLAGSAYVFVRSAGVWSEQQRLLASDGAASDRFGWAVSVWGDTVAVGAYAGDTSNAQDAGSAYVFVRSGTTWSEQQKLVAQDGATDDEFGYAVSAANDTVVVGARWDDTGTASSMGSAYVFARAGGTWTQQQKLLPSDPTSAWFGSSVSISNDTVVVGELFGDNPGGNADTGSAYVFTRSGTTWLEQQRLFASNGAGDDHFGQSVSISGDTVIVGAPFNSAAAPVGGSAYVFVRVGTSWTEQQTLQAPDAEVADFFGSSVSVSGESVAIGGPGDDTPGGDDAGSGRVYTRAGATWTEQQQLFGLDGILDYFGTAVALDGDTAIIGARYDTVPGPVLSGSAYIFTRSGTAWVEQQKLQAPNPTVAADFGTSVSLSGDTAVVGAPSHVTAGGLGAGSVYVFVRSGASWTVQQELTASDGAEFDHLGQSVSVFGDTIVVGTYADDNGNGVDAGAAYVFVRSGTTWTEQQKVVPGDGAAGDHFGISVTVSLDTAVIGADDDDSRGSAYVFVRSGTSWTQQQKLLAPDGAANDRFGYSVSLSGDTVVVASPLDDNANGVDGGSAYVFARSGSVWTHQQTLVASPGAAFDVFAQSLSIDGETLVAGGRDSAHMFLRSGTTWSPQQVLVAPDGAVNDGFGDSVAISGDTVVVGAPHDDTAGGENAGSAHVFRGYAAAADLAITKTDGQTTATPGEPLTYTVVVANGGPDAAVSATVTDSLPTSLVGPTWNCVASAGSSCTASGAGNINDTVDLLVGGTATYTVAGTVDAAATGSLVNTGVVAPPPGLPDPDTSNNSSTDVDTLTPETDLSVTKTDLVDPVNPGDPLAYSVGIVNDGPSNATGVTVTDTLPAGVTFVSSIPGPPTCSLASNTVTCGLGSVAASGTSAVAINVTVDPGVSGMLVNTATVSGSETDPDTGNNTATAATAVGSRDGELAHGTNEVYDLAALPGPVVDEDVFRIKQAPHSSYEIVIDATSGDIGAGNGPILERLAPDGTTVLQTSEPVGAGPSRSLRWGNPLPYAVEGETIRVRSAGCTTDCGSDDVYRIRAYETTYSVARFNNTGSQVTVLILQNPTAEPMSGVAYFRDLEGALVCGLAFGWGAHSTVVFDTATCPGAGGIAGSITVSHSRRYGEITGKAVSLEPATGFSFDSPLVPRAR